MIESRQLEDTNSDNPIVGLLLRLTLGVEEAETSRMAFEVVLSEICQFLDWPLGHVFILSEKDDKMVSAQIWYPETLPPNLRPFQELSETTPFSPGQGTIGTVWETGKPVAILDLHDGRQFTRRLPHHDEGGLRGYFAFPVRTKGEVSAVLEFFSLASVAPDEQIISIINHVGALLGLALQRQRNMRALQRSEARLAEAQQSAHLGHWEWDIIADSVSWSEEVYRIFGLEPTTLDSTFGGFQQYIHPADLEDSLGKIENAYKHAVPFDYYHRIVRPDDTVRIVHARGHPETDQTGKVVRLHGTVQDITEQKQTELRLADTVRQLSAMMEIGQALSSSLQPDAIYGRVMSTVRPLLDAEALVLLLEENGRLEIAAMDYETRTNPDKTLDLAGSGLISEAWNEGQSLMYSGEAAQRLAPHNMAAILGSEPRAAIAVPVRWHKKPIGVLAAVHSNPDAFAEEDLQLIEMAAAWTSIAIDNARQYEQLQRRLNESDAIMAISNAFTKTLDLDILLQLIANQAHDIVPHADWIAIHLLDTSGDRLVMVANAGMDVDHEDYTVAAGEGITGEVLATGQVLNVPDVQDDPRQLPIDSHLQTRALVVAPVEGRSQRIGTISMQCAGPGAFGPDDERLLTILGVQAGMAIENAQLVAAQEGARARAERQRERMRAMARRVVEAQEKERERIARELHDESGQALTSLKISLGLLQAQLPDELESVRIGIDDLLSLTDKTMTNLRLLSHNLRPPGLEIYGLDAALDGLCQDFHHHTHLEVKYAGNESLEVADLPALSIYRFAQEALTNVAKHAEATQIFVSLSEESGMIKLVVEDNGQGFSPPDLEQDSKRGGVGLLGMNERLEMVSGYLTIDSKPGQGSRLTAMVPKVKNVP